MKYSGTENARTKGQTTIPVDAPGYQFISRFAATEICCIVNVANTVVPCNFRVGA